MSTNARATAAYSAALLAAVLLAVVSPYFAPIAGFGSLLIVALLARYLGFGPALVFAAVWAIALWAHVLPLLFHGQPVLFLFVRVSSFLAVAFVIAMLTRRKSLQVREAEDRYRNLVEFSPDGIVVTDETGKILFANSALARTLGAKDAASLLGHNYVDFIQPNDRQEARQRIDRLVAGQTTPWVVSDAIRLDGVVVQVERAGVPVRIENRVLAQGFVRDVTEREQTRRRLQALFDTAIDAIVFIDSTGRPVDANPAACELLGYSREEIQAMPFDSLVAPDEREAIKDLCRELSDSRRMSGRMMIMRKGGETREVEYRTVSNILPGLHGAFMHDITDRTRAEESLRQLSGRLLRLQDEERRRIAQQLHETTAQTLIALKLNLAKARQSTSDGDTLKNALDETESLAEQSINEVRTLSYLLHPPMIDEIGLVPSVEWFIRGFQERTAIHVDLSAASDIGRFSPAIETAVFRIIQEALTNVQRHARSANVTIRIVRSADDVRLVIEDMGRGLPEGLRGQPIEVVAAAGVGVAGMYQRARDLGGTMNLRSDDHGTCIEVRLPIREE